MVKFIPLKDNNTGVVYEWRMVDDSGAETVKTLFRDQWKPERSWTVEELNELFSTPKKAKPYKAKKVEAVVEEVEDNEPLFSEDFSTPGED